MKRAFLLVPDSVGIGGARDAADHGDDGADTLGHVAAACAANRADREGLRRGSLRVPHLERLGLGAAAHVATGRWPVGFVQRTGFTAAYGACDEASRGKDTPSGHWEMCGLPVEFSWGTFPPGPPSFPPELTDALIARGNLPGMLGNCAMSGTEIVAQLGAEHVATGKPIVYTSIDSVVQIAAHQEAFGLERLYALCEIARELVDPYRIGRVIARPFIGEEGNFERTLARRDYMTPPHGPTLLNAVEEAGGRVIGVGKVHDIFAGHGVTESIKGGHDDAVFDATLEAATRARDGDLVFANFVDFDTLYGHRRDVPGYAAALEAFDRRLPELDPLLRPGDLVVLAADHGCDPTWKGTDHTRERVPFLAYGPGVPAVPLGVRASFADVGQTIARHLGLPPLAAGEAALT